MANRPCKIACASHGPGRQNLICATPGIPSSLAMAFCKASGRMIACNWSTGPTTKARHMALCESNEVPHHCCIHEGRTTREVGASETRPPNAYKTLYFFGASKGMGCTPYPRNMKQYATGTLGTLGMRSWVEHHRGPEICIVRWLHEATLNGSDGPRAGRAQIQ